MQLHQHQKVLSSHEAWSLLEVFLENGLGQVHQDNLQRRHEFNIFQSLFA